MPTAAAVSVVAESVGAVVIGQLVRSAMKKNCIRLFWLLSPIFFAITASCSKKISDATNDTEFAQLLADAFKSGDYEALEELWHPDTPVEMIPKARKLLEPFFEFRPEDVSYRFTALSEIDIELPGSIDGKTLAYTQSVDGVVHLVGKSQGEYGETTIDLFIPFQRVSGSYRLAAFDYAPAPEEAEQ